MYSQNCPEFQLFLEHIPAAIAMFDREMRYLATSRRWLTDNGLDKPSLIGRCHYEVFPETPDRWKAVHERCLAGYVESSEADSIVLANGSVEWVKWESRPWYNHNGEIGGIVLFTEVITEHKQTKEALRVSEARFQKLAANVPGVIYQFLLRTDNLMCCTYISSGCRQLFELEPEKAQQFTKIYQLIHPDDRQFFSDSMAVSADTLLPMLWEGRIITPSGQIKSVRSVSRRPCKRSSGDIVWDGLMIDISDRVQAEQQLRQYQEDLEAKVKYRTAELQKANEQLQAEIIERQRAELAQRQSEKRFRELARREQLLNRLASQIRNSLDVDTVIQTAIAEIQQLLEIDRCTFCWYKPNADPPTWEAIKEAKNPDLPSLLGLYPATVVGPLTQQLLNQEILRIDNVATFTEPILRQLSQSLGYQSQVVLPIKTLAGEIGAIVCADCTHPRPWTDSEVELLQAVVDQLAIAINQAELYAQTHQAAVNAQKQARQIEQTLEELKKTQTQLVQNEKMSSLGQLVAGVAHEINNPVNFIYGNLAHASDYTKDILNLLKLYQQHTQPTLEIQEEIDAIDLDFVILDLPKLLTSMKVGADRIRGIVRSLRNFSRHDEAQIKAVDIHEGIDSTLMILQQRLKAKSDFTGIQIIKNYGKLPLVECYAGQLNQVFMNLLANAIDALEEHYKSHNSTISHSQMAHSQMALSSFCLKTNSVNEFKISNPQIHIQTEILSGSRIAIRIADNGSGMTPEIKQRLFEPFFTTKPVGVGTGLGLSISYQIVVEKHNGQLHCFSQIGQGTEFVIELPIFQRSNNQ